jgi:phage major head subunit gpT-like protein
VIINSANLHLIFEGYSTAFHKGLEGAPRHWDRVAMTAPSTARSNTYAWLGQLPGMREWIGDRIIKNLRAHSYAIENVTFESTIEVPRPDIEDDQYGVFSPLFSEMGQQAGEHPDQLVFSLLANGFSGACYDDKPFFAADHPVRNATGAETAVSNMQAGTDPAWFLLDCSRALKPLIFQERTKYDLTALTGATDETVFMRDKFVYGVRARANAGYGLWQLAFGSKAPLTAENYEAARLAMRSFTGDEGRPLNIRPDTLVVPPALEGDARRLVNNATRVVTVGDPGTPVTVDNEWAGTAEPIVTAWLNT